MSRYTGATTKKDRRFGLLPEPVTKTKRMPRGKRQRRKSNYGLQLEEKQKLRYLYGIQERQFRRYFEVATTQKANTGFILLQQLERRLDNVVYRLGFAPNRRTARQLVNHGHVRVNDRKVDIPSYQVKVDDTITFKSKTLEIPYIKENMEITAEEKLVSWLLRKAGVGMVKSLPAQDQLREDIDLQLIVEYYSR